MNRLVYLLSVLCYSSLSNSQNRIDTLPNSNVVSYVEINCGFLNGGSVVLSDKNIVTLYHRRPKKIDSSYVLSFLKINPKGDIVSQTPAGYGYDKDTTHIFFQLIYYQKKLYGIGLKAIDLHNSNFAVSSIVCPFDEKKVIPKWDELIEHKFDTFYKRLWVDDENSFCPEIVNHRVYFHTRYQTYNTLGDSIDYYSAEINYNFKTNKFSYDINLFKNLKKYNIQNTYCHTDSFLYNYYILFYYNDTITKVSSEYIYKKDFDFHLLDSFKVHYSNSLKLCNFSSKDFQTPLKYGSNFYYNFGMSAIYSATPKGYVDSLFLLLYKVQNDTIYLEKQIQYIDYKGINQLYGPNIQNIVINRDKSIYLTFINQSLFNNNYISIYKLDSNYNIIWKKKYVDPIGVYYMVGNNNMYNAISDSFDNFFMTFIGNDSSFDKKRYYYLWVDKNGNQKYLSGIDSTKFELNTLQEPKSFEEVEIYPNPSYDKLYIKSNNNKEFEYFIFDSEGKMVKNGTTHHKFIDTSPLITGTYVIQFYQNMNLIANKKLIIKK